MANTQTTKTPEASKSRTHEFGVHYSDTCEVSTCVDRGEAERIAVRNNSNAAPLYVVTVVTRAVTDWVEAPRNGRH